MKKEKKLTSFDFTDDLKEKDMLLIKGGVGAAFDETTNNCHSAICNTVAGCGLATSKVS